MPKQPEDQHILAMMKVTANAIQFTQDSPVATFNPMIAALTFIAVTYATMSETPLSPNIAKVASPFMHSQTRREKVESQKMQVIISTVLLNIRPLLGKRGAAKLTDGTSRHSISVASVAG